MTLDFCTEKELVLPDVEELELTELRDALSDGEASPVIENFDAQAFLLQTIRCRRW